MGDKGRPRNTYVGDIPDPHIGETWEQLTILSAERVWWEKKNCYRIIYHTRCSCGKTGFQDRYRVLSKQTKSCGCLNRIRLLEVNTVHGQAGRHHTRTYRVWKAMQDRTRNPHDRAWKGYGGRGIRICERWAEFENFFADMGEAPLGYSIDRIDNDKGYYKENCRWATPKEQNRNRRSNKYLEYDATKKTIAEWAEIYAVPYIYFWKKSRLNLAPLAIKQLYLENQRLKLPTIKEKL